MSKFKFLPCVTFVLFSLFFHSGAIFAAGPNITVCSIDANGARGTAWTLNGANGVNLRAKLLNATNFSPTGTQQTTFTIVDSFGASGSITAASLLSNGCEVFFQGYVEDTNVTAAELTAIVNWVNVDGGILISTADTSDYNAFPVAFGYETTNSLATIWDVTDAGLVHPMFDGPFGTASSLLTNADKVRFDSSTGATVLADITVIGVNPPTILDRPSSNGHAVFIGDVDVLTTEISSGNGNNTSQDHATLNLFAFAADMYNSNNYVPSTPIITSPSDNAAGMDDTPTVSGTADPGSVITVTGPNGETCTTTADFTTGIWSCAISPALPEGSNTIEVISSYNGVDSTGTATINYIVDTTAPTAPVINPINEGTNPITGLAEPGSTVNLTGVVCSNAPIIADANGNWSCVPDAPITPGQEIGATTTDPSGNASLPASATVGNSVTESDAPTVNPVPAGATEISGTAVAGSSIDLGAITCSNAPVTADAAGQWTCETPDPVPATGNAISVTATQTGLLASPPTTTTVFNPVITAPTAPQVDPTDGTVVTGTTIPNGEVTVLDDEGNVLCSTTANGNGDFTCSPLSPVPADGDVISVVVADENSNSSSPTNVMVDLTAPTAPVITSPVDGSSTNDTTPLVIGTGEPGATINVTGPNGESCIATVDLTGNWFCEVTPALTDGEIQLTATATDAVGNTSLAENITITIDIAAPLAPTIDSPTNGTPISGTGEPGATVTVTTPSDATCTAVVQANGTWACTLSPTPEEGEDITAIQADPAGNQSPPVTVVGGIDITPPSAPSFTSPTNGLTASGTGEEGATVNVSTPSGASCSAVVQANGTWSCTLSPEADVVDGETATATQTDGAGNESGTDTATIAYNPNLMGFITNCVAGVQPAESMLYEVSITNPGNMDITGAQVSTNLGGRMSLPTWDCQAVGGASCGNLNGTGDLNELVDLPVGSELIYTFESDVTGALMEFIDVEATVTMPAGTTDSDSSNNSAFDSDLIYQFVFKDGFECAAPGTIQSTNKLFDSLSQ